MRRGDAVAVVALFALLVTLAFTAPRLSRYWPQPPAPESPRPRAVSGAPRPEHAAAEKRINVKLYFGHEEEPALVPEDREIGYATELGHQIRTVVEELVKGSSQGHLAPFPPETRVLGVFVTPAGTAYVDLSKEATAGGAAGSVGERLAVYALVNSITANFPAIRRVQLLVDDRAAETLAGHLDLSRPLAPDMTLVAVKAPPLSSTEASPPPEPKASPTPSPPPERKT